jgi:hypothetical protein
MIDNPRDQHGEPLMFPGAPAPDAAAHREATLQHVIRMAELDVGYARWVAGTMGRECPDWHGDLLERLDADLSARNVRRPAPYLEPPSKLPALPKGPRGLPKHRFFHDAL